jgi:outer membrane protein assembly factor BamD (BamD/ComL family)
MVKFFKRGFFALAVVFVLGACKSGPIVVPEGLSAAELIQRGQEASDKNRYNQALQYYEAIIERFPSDIDDICAAEYEIAFIHYKQKRYAEARRELDALLLRYTVPDAEFLPPQFKILATIVLERLTEKENEKTPWVIITGKITGLFSRKTTEAE